MKTRGSRTTSSATTTATTVLLSLALVVLSVATTAVDAFSIITPPAASTCRRTSAASRQSAVLHMSGEESSSSETTTEEAAFVPITVVQEADTTKDDEEKEATTADADEMFDTVEQKMAGGRRKSKRGKRKSKRKDKAGAASTAAAAAASRPSKSNLAPEEVFYEGPPAITETIAPTASILTVVGIIPAAAAWARQAWVRYKITNRRIRVKSGINGQDMAEIVYPDIVELRTAKRLFGDGDLVAFLRDGAKFEMRNIPNFEETMEFILKQVPPTVAEQWREKGDVTNKPSPSSQQ